MTDQDRLNIWDTVFNGENSAFLDYLHRDLKIQLGPIQTNRIYLDSLFRKAVESGCTEALIWLAKNDQIKTIMNAVKIKEVLTLN
jgi:hypothetical protein